MNFLPTLPLTLTPLMAFGLILVIGALGGFLAHRLHWLPSITGFMLVGFICGPSGLGVLGPEVMAGARIFVDIALVLSEYSPKVTGTQPVEDFIPLHEHNPARIRFAANINPHLHFPVADELERQLGLGAVALKVHPVHGGFPVNERALYPAYAICQERGVPVVVHCGTSTFPGAMNQFGDPILLDDVLRDFPRLSVVLAHGGRGWWYDAAAFLALANPNVWIELSGLPPSRLTTYYQRHNWNRLTKKMIFGTDWPDIPGIAANARAVAALLPDDATTELVLSGNAIGVYRL